MCGSWRLDQQDLKPLLQKLLRKTTVTDIKSIFVRLG